LSSERLTKWSAQPSSAAQPAPIAVSETPASTGIFYSSIVIVELTRAVESKEKGARAAELVWEISRDRASRPRCLPARAAAR